MVKNIGTPSLVERYGGRVDSPPMSHGVSVFSLGDYHGSKTKLSFGRRTQVRLATHGRYCVWLVNEGKYTSSVNSEN